MNGGNPNLVITSYFGKVVWNSVTFPKKDLRMPKKPDWQHVAAAIQARMTKRQMILADLVRESGVSDTSLRKYLAGGEIYRAKVKWQIAGALGWPDDAIDRLAQGEDPAALDPDPPMSVPDAIALDPTLNEEGRAIVLAAYRTAQKS